MAWKLAAVLAGEAGEALLDTHQAERAPHARALVRLAVLVGALMTGGGRGAAAVRRAVLAGVDRIPAVAAFATDSRTPPLRRGPLVERSGRAGRRLAGTLLPRAQVARRRPALPGRRACSAPARATLSRAASGLVVHAGGRRIEVDDVDGVLSAWLGSARTVVVRPDRIIRSAV